MRIATEFEAGKLVMLLEADGHEEGWKQLFRVPLSRSHEGRELEEAHILLKATGGHIGSKLHEHLTDHFTSNTVPSGTCEFCKLQGRILASEGRRRLTEREASKAKIVVVRPGITGEGLMRAEEERIKRAQSAEARKPRLGGAKASEAWF